MPKEIKQKIIKREGLLINEHIIKFSGMANLPRPLKENHSYQVNGEFDIININHANKQNGTKDLIYCAKSTGIIEISEGTERPIYAKKITTPSQKLRFAIEMYHQEHNGEPGYDFINAEAEDFYENTIKLINGNLPNIIRLVFNK